MNSRAYVINVCCLLAGGVLGVALIYGLGARSAGKTTSRPRQTQSAGKTASAHENKDSDGKSSIVGRLVTQDDFRGFLQQWIDADCPRDASDDAKECVRRWAKIDPHAVLAFISESAKFRDRNDACVGALSEMGKNDIPGVVAWLKDNRDEKEAVWLARCVLDNLTKSAPVQAGELLLSDLLLALLEQSGYQALDVMRELAKKSPRDALSLFERFPDGAKEASAAYLTSSWAQENWQAAADWCEKQQGRPYAKAAIMGLLQQEALQGEPEQAAVLIKRFGVDLSQNVHLIDMIASRDPLVALDLLKTVSPENSYYPMVAGTIMRTLFSENPEYGMQAARALYPENESPRAMAALFSQWINSDRKAAEAWLAALPDADLRSKLQTMQAAKDDPAAFLAAMNANASAKNEWKGTIETTLDTTMLMARPREAFDWMLDNPEYITDLRVKRAMRGIDGEVGLEKIEAMPEGAARDTVLMTAGAYWAQAGKFDQAESALPSVTDPQAQTALRFQIFSEMAKNSAHASEASQWLAGQPVSQEVRESWEAIVNNKPAEDADLIRFR